MKPIYLLSLELLYISVGLLLAVVAVGAALNPAHPRRWGSTVFWSLLAAVFVFGTAIPPLVTGYMVIVMVLLAATKQVEPPRLSDLPRIDRVAEALRLGNRLFWPPLLVPAIALVGSRVVGRIHFGNLWLADEKQATLVALGCGALVALVVGWRMIGAHGLTPAREGARLVEMLSWSIVLPQLLAALGGVFQKAGVGAVVADLAGRALPTQYPFVAVATYCVGMAVFTICMGNAFAAFAVITGGIGLPLIVQQHHGNPAIMAAIGMLSGYCGTLITPMAANFNLVPVLLLELPDRNAVIKAQLPIAVTLLAANVAIMYVCVYRF